MPRNSGTGVYSPPTNITAVSGAPIESADWNAKIQDDTTLFNSPWPVGLGGTGVSSLAGFLATLGGLPLAGGTLTGPLTLSGDATAALQPVTKQQFDAALASSTATNAATYLVKSGGTLTGSLTLSGNATAALQPITKQQFDAYVPTKLSTATGAAPSYSARAILCFNGLTGAIKSSQNISSVTRTGVGAYTIAFQNDMPHANYSIAGTVNGPGGNAVSILAANAFSAPTLKTVSQVSIVTTQVFVEAQVADFHDINIVVFA
jgi:hypothetical protein